MTKMALNVPPGRKGFLIELRESIAYLMDGDKFIKDRTAEFGPIFSTTLFFRPTVVVGGQQNVAEFLQVEQSVVESSLPLPLQALMTDRNLLLQSGDRPSASRRMMAPILNADALKTYLPTIERRAEEFIADLAQRDETYLAKELVRFCLQLFAELFSGHALTEEEERLFTVYNGGLFALTTWEPSFVAARTARETLDGNMRRRFEDARRDGLLDTDRFAVFRHISSAVDEKGERSYDPGYGVTQLIWGAYIEGASLMCSSIRCLMSRPDCAARVRAEAAAAGVLGASASTRLGDWALPYTTGVLRESLRVAPPAGGGFRVAGEPIRVGGFDVPAGVVVTPDPRVGNQV
jgi:retinoid hydroxylase